jgi:hypothetical protein
MIVNINSIGQYLYLDFVIHFLVVGLILLLAIIGSVALTVDFGGGQIIKNQHLFKQLSRTSLETFYVID